MLLRNRGPMVVRADNPVSSVTLVRPNLKSAREWLAVHVACLKGSRSARRGRTSIGTCALGMRRSVKTVARVGNHAARRDRMPSGARAAIAFDAPHQPSCDPCACPLGESMEGTDLHAPSASNARNAHGGRGSVVLLQTTILSCMTPAFGRRSRAPALF